MHESIMVLQHKNANTHHWQFDERKKNPLVPVNNK
jgi:hypothetical protein